MGSGSSPCKGRGTCPGTLLLGQAQCTKPVGGHLHPVPPPLALALGCVCDFQSGLHGATHLGASAGLGPITDAQWEHSSPPPTPPHRCSFPALAPGLSLSHPSRPPVLQTGPALGLISPLPTRTEPPATLPPTLTLQLNSNRNAFPPALRYPKMDFPRASQASSELNLAA